MNSRFLPITPFALSLLVLCTSAGCNASQDRPSSAISPSAPSVVRPSSRAPSTDTPKPAIEPTPVYTYKIVNIFPHDCHAFTQGLQYVDGLFYEGTGLMGGSSLRKVDIKSGKPFKTLPIDNQYFGEGITFLNGKIYQLTWQSHIGFVYEANTFRRLKSFTYPTEGWGITHDGKKLIMSDGSATLYFWDPETLKEIGSIQVTDQGTPIANLNELEYVNGEVYANVWQTDRIARIDPKTGHVTAWIDLTGILKPEDIPADCEPDVLNGIAYDEKGDRLFVTGKQWPKLYEIKLVKKG